MDGLVGAVVDGAYRVEALVGQGGMARVYQVADLATGDTLAMKVIAAAGRDDLDAQRRFRREFETCAGLEHPNVVRLHRLGALPDGAWYFTMDFLPWPSLAERLRREGRLPEPRALALLLQALEGLAAVHARGVVHRDLKPANMLVADDGRLVLVDFGLARAEGRTQLTATGTVLGTPFYMPPELVRGERADARADLYALGAVAQELLTGRPPFEADAVTTLFTKIVQQQPPPPSSRAPGIAPGWDALVGACLAKDPAERPASALALREQLLGLQRELLARAAAGRGASRGASGEPRAGAHASREAAPHEGSGTPPPARRWSAALTLPVVLAAVAAGLALGWRTPGVGSAPPAWRADDVRVVADVGAATIAWRSPTPYVSAVALDGRPDVRFSGAEPGATTSHQVVVAPLADGREAHVRVVFPDGTTSLPRALTPLTPRVEELVVAEAQPGAGVLLMFRCQGGTSADVVVSTPGGERPPVVAPRSPDGRWSCRLEQLPPDAEELRLRLHCIDGRSRELSLAATLRAELPTVARPLLAFDGPRFARDLERGTRARLRGDLAARTGSPTGTAGAADGPGLDRKGLRRSVAGALLPEHATELGLPAAWLEICRRAPLAFGTRLLPLQEELQAYRALVNGFQLEGYARALQVAPRFLFTPRPWLGALGPEGLPAAPPDTSVDLLGGSSPTLGLTLVSSMDRLKLAPVLPPWRALRAARLVLEAEPFRRFCIRFRWNDRADLWLFDGSSGEPKPRTVTVEQAVPAPLLQPGANRLELFVERFLDHDPRFTSTLRALRVDLWFRR